METVCHASLCSVCHQDPRGPTTVVHQHQNTNVKHDICTRTVIYASSSPIRQVHTLQGSEIAAFTQRKWSAVQWLLSTKAQIKGYYLTQIQGQTLDILWVFYAVQNFYHRKFIQPHDDWITNPASRWVHHTEGFFFFTTTTFKDLVYGQSSIHWYRLRVSSSRVFFLFYHEPYQPQRINKVGVSFQTTPMGKITYTHSPRTGVDSSKTYRRVQIFIHSPRTKSKCLQNPWGVTLTMEPHHHRRLQDAMGFSFFTTTTNKYSRVLHTRV